VTNTRRLVLATASSRAGDVVAAVALVVVVADRTSSATWLAIAGMATLVPYAVLSAPAGMLAGRFDRRRVAVASDGCRAVLLAFMTVLVVMTAPLALILAGAALTSVVGAFHRPALVSLIPRAVGEDGLATTNASLAVVENVVGLVGPLVAGLAILGGAPALAFAFDAATFVASAVLLCAVTATCSAGDGRNSGARLRSTSEVRTVIVALVCAALVYGHETVLLALYAQRQLGSAASLTLLESAVAAGGLLAAWPAARLAKGAGSTAVLLPAVAALGSPLAVLPLVSSPPAACALLLVEGAANVVVDVVALTLIQRHTLSSNLAAVTGCLDAAVAGALLVGVAAAPVTIGALGVSGALAAAGVALPVTAAAAHLHQIRTRVSSRCVPKGSMRSSRDGSELCPVSSGTCP
jgi:hypothetical protein